MHKLFVICDDPNGVVECNSSRRSFSCVPREERDDKRRKKKKKGNTNLSRNDVELLRNPSLRQIHRIAKGSPAVEDAQVPSHASRVRKNTDALKRGGSVKNNLGAILTRSRSADERRCPTGNNFESPNVIAKLMGLDEVPSNPKAEPEKIKRPILEVNSSKATEKMETKEKTLTRVLEIVKSKGLLTMAYDRSPQCSDTETSLVLIKPIPRQNAKISEIKSSNDEEKAREVRVRKIASHLEVVRKLEKEQFDAKLTKIKLKLEHRKRMLVTTNFASISYHEQTSSSDYDDSKALGGESPEISVKRLLQRDVVSWESESLKIRDSKDMEAKLGLDFAREYVERKRLRESGAAYGEKTAEEIWRGIETLRRFSLGGENDNICEALENDMRYGCYISGMWEMGWRRVFTSDDEGMAVADVANLLLLDLIRELFL